MKKALDLVKAHYGSLLLLVSTTKFIFLGASLAESICFGFITLLTGWQIYLAHIRLHNIHQRQINLLKKDIQNLKVLSVQVSAINASIAGKASIQNGNKNFTWSGQ